MTASGRPPVSLLVTDLDNTLYDWVTFFVLSLDAMMAEACKLLGVSEQELADQLRAVHQHHHNSEHPFALLETQIVEERYPGLSRLERLNALDSAFHAFNSRRKQTLILYPGVEEALAKLSGTIPVVGHTEATVPNALFRLKKLGVAGRFRKLYAVEPSEDPHPNPDADTVHDDNPPVRYLGHDERKPDTRVLLDICEEFGVAPENTLYVGDSVSRDIGMALAVGASAAWAEYGTRYDESLWDRLVRVTHWTAEDVARAQAARELYGSSTPHVTLETSFGELLDHFDFRAP